MAKYSDRVKITVVVVFSIVLLIILLTILEIQRKNKIPIDKNCSFNLTSELNKTSTLPIIVIDTGGVVMEESIVRQESIEHFSFELYQPSKRYPATFKMYDVCTGKIIVSENINISFRGQSSLSKPKKQFSLIFLEDDSTNKDISLLSMPKSAKWILNGAHSDETQIRNALAYRMANQTMEYAPRTKYVEVFLRSTNEPLTYDKNYLGVYTLMEKIERNKNRVDVMKKDDRYNDISFIISRDKIKIGDRTYTTNWQELGESVTIGEYGVAKLRSTLKVIYPGAAKLTPEYKRMIEEYFNNFENALYSSKFKDKSIGYQKYVDVESFIDSAMINEIFKNIDGCEVSAYFYKDVGGLLKAGPVWDFDLSSGNTGEKEVNEPTGLRIVNTIWYNRMFQDPYFVSLYQKRYEYLRKTIWTNEKIIAMIDQELKDMKGAQYRNYDKWYFDYELSYNAEINNLKKFLIKRLDWLDKNITSVRRYEQILE